MKKVFSLFLSILLATCAIIPASSAFAATSPIKTSGKDAIMTFAAWGDPQVSNIMSSRGKYAAAASKDLKNAESDIDALVLAGDITENGFKNEYTEVYNDLVDTGISNFITSTGNHDIRLGQYADAKSKFISFTNDLNAAVGSSIKIDSMYYSCNVKGYDFIVLGSETTQLEEADISDTQLKWLDSKLKATTNKGKPVFVVIHQPLKETHGLPDTWGSSNVKAGTVGPQSDEIKSILNKYKNVVLISGHLHAGFGKYSYEKIGNIHCVNLPSIGVDNNDGSYNENGIGYMVEIFSNRVVFRARNFNTGEYVSDYNININLDRVKSSSLSATSYTYDGKAKTPSVTLYDYNSKKISSSNYTVTYPRDRKNVGTYQIKITFKGDYKGNPEIYKTFTINPKGTSLSSVLAGSKKFTVKWNKQSTQTTGYQIQYATKKDFSNAATIYGGPSTANSKTITGRAGNTRYYVRIRTYKNIGGKYFYSSWSSTKSVVTSK